MQPENKCAQNLGNKMLNEQKFNIYTFKISALSSFILKFTSYIFDQLSNFDLGKVYDIFYIFNAI